jgi:hypothetical protein
MKNISTLKKEVIMKPRALANKRILSSRNIMIKERIVY